MACYICRLCLKITNDNNFEIIEQVTKEILQKLLLNLNLDISREPIICANCADQLQKSIDFKSICYCTEEEALLFMKPDKDTTMNPNKISLMDNESIGISDISNSEKTCRFCRKCAGSEYSHFLKDSKEHLFIANVLKRHIPELNFTLGEDTITCSLCFESIQTLYTFILRCLTVEEKIDKYVEVEGRDDKGQISLNNILKFTFPSVVKCENFNHCAVPKTEELNYELIKNKYLKCTAMEEIEDEHQVKPDIIESITVKTEIADENEEENMMFNSAINIETEFVGIKSEHSESFQDLMLISNNTRTGDINAEISGRQSPPIVYTAQTNKNSVNAENPLKCNVCSFETKHKRSLSRHMLTHANPSDVRVYTCDECPYKAKHQHNLNAHMLVHKKPSDINMFKCELCTYEAKYKHNLTKHMVIHGNILEMHKCQLCTFETKHKKYLKVHMRIHQEPEFKMYKCDICGFKMRHKESVNQHMLTHKDLSEVTGFTCQVCSFQTKYKKNLIGHLETHKDPSELTMYKCKLCPFKTRLKYYLKDHGLIHQNPSDVTMYACKMCTYQTKRKNYLKTHMLIHTKSMQS